MRFAALNSCESVSGLYSCVSLKSVLKWSDKTTVTLPVLKCWSGESDSPAGLCEVSQLSISGASGAGEQAGLLSLSEHGDKIGDGEISREE